MKIQLELHSETLAEFRAELATFLAPEATAAVTMPAVATPITIVESAVEVLPTDASNPSSTRKSRKPATEPRTKVRSGLTLLNVTHSDTETGAEAKPSAADIAMGLVAENLGDLRNIAPSSPTLGNTPARSDTDRTTRTAADIALGLDPDDVDTVAIPTVDHDTEVARQTDIEDLLANKAQLNFDFDRVLALQGRTAALGIVQGVLPAGAKIKIKDIEALPVALIPAAIAALQAAQEA